MKATSVSARQGTWARWGLAALLALALAAQIHRAWSLLTASRILRAVDRVSRSLLAQGEVPPPILVHNIDLLLRAERLDPANPAPLLSRGGQLFLLRRPEEARRVYFEALALEPRGEIYFNLSRALSALGREAEAKEAAATAFRLHPSLRRAARGGWRTPP